MKDGIYNTFFKEVDSSRQISLVDYSLRWIKYFRQVIQLFEALTSGERNVLKCIVSTDQFWINY